MDKFLEILRYVFGVSFAAIGTGILLEGCSAVWQLGLLSAIPRFFIGMLLIIIAIVIFEWKSKK